MNEPKGIVHEQMKLGKNNGILGFKKSKNNNNNNNLLKRP
jgi:hypothetical protein